MIAIKFVAEADLKALGKAEKKLNSFGKSASKLGRNLGLAFGTAAILSYGKASIKAFAADDKAAKILSKSLDNLGLHFADPKVKQFIADLEKQYGVLDDFLRPAYQKLLTTTGDYTASQNLLKTALDLSAMSGSDVVSVAGDLAKAYAGNTRGLIKYGIGLSKTELAAMSFEDILKQIAKVSEGQAKTAADSFAGSLDKLTVASANAKEMIGKSLVQALTELGGEGGLPNTISLIEKLSSGIGDAIIGASRLAKIFGFFIYNTKGTNPITQMNEFNKKNAIADAIAAGKLFPSTNTGLGNLMEYQKNAKLDAAAKKSAADKIAADKKAAALKLAQEKKIASDKKVLAKGNALFDLEQIGVVAALKMSVDKETRLRLELLRAIQLDDADLVLAKMKELAAWQATSDMAKLSNVKTISEKQLSSINTTLLAELDAISKSKMSDAEKDNARTAAWTRYNDAIKYAGGLAALSTYSQKLQDQELTIQRLASIQKISQAQTAADNIKQAALETYLATLAKGVPTIVTPKSGPSFTPAPFVPLPEFPTMPKGEEWSGFINLLPDSAGTSTASSNDSTIVLNFNAPVTTTSSDEFARLVQKAIQNNNRFGNNLDYAGAI